MKIYRILDGQHLLHDDFKAEDEDHARQILMVVYGREAVEQFTVEEIQAEGQK